MQTRGDVWSSMTVIAALVGARSGLPILDPIAALVVACFIGYAGYQIARATTGILSDRIVMSDAELQGVVMGVSGVIGCHQIRTRGSADHVFLDLHIWLPPDMRLTDAHDLSHVVKDRLMTRYPQIADAIIHIEPPPAGDQIVLGACCFVLRQCILHSAFCILHFTSFVCTSPTARRS